MDEHGGEKENKASEEEEEEENDAIGKGKESTGEAIDTERREGVYNVGGAYEKGDGEEERKKM